MGDPTLTGPIAAAMPDWLSRGLGLAGEPAASAPRQTHLHHGPDECAVSTVNALAIHLCGYTANGWHLWRRTRDNRLLADLRTELALR